MVFIAPAVHYSALATLPPELTLAKSQQSIKHTASIRFNLNRIFKRLLTHDIHNEHTITTEIEEHVHLPKIALRLSETTEKQNPNNTSTVVKTPNNNNSGGGTSTGQELARSMPSLIKPFERLPFTEPYCSISSKTDKFPRFELSAYHKHCIHQQKYIDQKQYHHESSMKQIKSSQLNSSIKEHRSDLVNSRLQNLIDKPYQNKLDNKKSNSTTTLPVSSSLENRIGLQYASRRNTVANSHSNRSSCTQRLRRLHSKSKVRSIPSETKTSSVTYHKKSFPPATISSSIAHRIELLKQAMHNNQLELHQWKPEKTSPIESSSHPSNDTINRQTQTNDNQSKSSEIHHIHHHHIHSSSFLSLEWRTYLSIIGTLSIIFLLLIELTTIIF